MTKICQYCKCEFETRRGKVRYCSIQCGGMARRKLNFLKREARAAELGITLDELEKLIKRGRMGLLPSMPKHYKYTKRPKTYKEIQANNKRHPLVSGWRGQRVIGGGPALHNDPYLKPSEYARVRNFNH